MKRTLAMVVVALVVAPPAVVRSADELPVNKWTQLEATISPGYTYSPMVFAPGRDQVLFWGAVAHENGIKAGANDVRAFDAAALKWVSDYPSDPNQSWGFVGGGSGNAISYVGVGKMLESGRPNAAMIVNAMTWDSKRKQVVVSMPGLMAAYDPATKKWRDMEATTELHGHKLAGGPPVYGAGMCYDPVNDEIVMFPHFGAQQADMRKFTGRISGHLGTLRYSYKDNTWRRVVGELGADQVKGARAAVVTLLGKLSTQLDKTWPLLHAPDKTTLAGVKKELGDLADTIAYVSVGEGGQAQVSAAAADLKEAAGAKSADDVMAAGSRAAWKLDALLEGALAVEPPRRAVAPMVYDEKNQAIVMFGGDSGRIRTDLVNRIEDEAKRREFYYDNNLRLNDTWVYDCRKRQWCELTDTARPPTQQIPLLSYDPNSGLVLLVTISGNPYDKRVPRKAIVWSLDVAAGQWQKRVEQDWEGPIDRRGWYAHGIDPVHKLLLVTHTENGVQKTFAMRYDVGAMPAEPAPAWEAPPAETPTVLPPDDPAWVRQLKSLEANKWTAANPPAEPARRDWGSIACDPVRGWMVYFGGGHSTYQGTDVAIYQVGANRWIQQAGGHNDSIPPVGWGGYHMDLWGGNNAGHMRNQYVALDGRMFMNTGFGNQLKPRDGVLTTDVEVVSLPEEPHAWFYDIDRGGVWRQRPTDVVEGELPEPDRGRRPGIPHVVDPSGVVYGISIASQRYDNAPLGASVNIYNIYTGETAIRKVPKPWPNAWPESRPFCMRTGKGQIFLQDFDSKLDAKKQKGEQVEGPISRTWIYDIKANRFSDLQAANQPPGRALGTAYVADQDAVLAVMSAGFNQREEWVYSFKHNKWTPLGVDDKAIQFQAPYCQMDYVARYGVLVNYAGRTWVMRPDFSKLKWD